MVRRVVVGAVAAAVLLLVLAPVSGASRQTVYQAISAENKVVFHSAGYKLLLEPSVFKKTANIRRYLPKLTQLQGLLNRSATVVSHASVTSSRQKLGRADWVRGTRLMAVGIGDLVAEGTAVLAGNEGRVRYELAQEKRSITSGLARRDTGDSLLGLSKGD